MSQLRESLIVLGALKIQKEKKVPHEKAREHYLSHVFRLRLPRFQKLKS